MTSRGAQMVAGILGKDIWRERSWVTTSYLPFMFVNMSTATRTTHKQGRAVVVLQYRLSDSDSRQYRHTPTGALMSNVWSLGSSAA